MTFDKYKIRHVDLAAGTGLTLEAGCAHYCVFWHRTIPLGQVYLDHAPLDSGTLLRQCFDAVWPTLVFYQSQQCQTNPLEQPKIISLETIRQLCDRVLGAQQPPGFTDRCDVSVVICTRNRPQHIKTCLTQLQQQFCKPSEIIVVDNASSTAETEQVVRQFPGVRYVREPRPGLDIARNRGAAEANGSIVAYTDDDTLPDPYWVCRVAETFGKSSAVAMTGLVLAASLDTEAEVIFERFWPFNRGYCQKHYDRRFIDSRVDTAPPVWEIGAGANMAFRKTVFEEIGYFDERLDVGAAGCSGDSEMWYRILANGFTITYNPMAVVHHNHRSTIGDLKAQLFGYMRGFTVAILIQYQRFGHRGNIRHLYRDLPMYYLRLIRKGFPKYPFQYRTLLAELSGLFSGLVYYWRHRNTNPNIFY